MTNLPDTVISAEFDFRGGLAHITVNVKDRGVLACSLTRESIETASWNGHPIDEFDFDDLAANTYLEEAVDMAATLAFKGSQGAFEAYEKGGELFIKSCVFASCGATLKA